MSYRKHLMTSDEPPAELYKAAEVGTNLAEVGTDCISREQAIDALRTCYDTETITMDNGDEYINYGDSVREIEQLPPIQPKRGKWIRTGSGSLYDNYKCSECGKAPKWDCMGDNRWKIAFTGFCPNCGAKMEEEE